MEKRKSGRVVVKKKVVTEWVDFSVTPYCRRNFQKFETFWAARRENPECGLSCLDLHCQFLCFRQSVVHVEGLCSKAVPHWRGGGKRRTAWCGCGEFASNLQQLTNVTFVLYSAINLFDEFSGCRFPENNNSLILVEWREICFVPCCLMFSGHGMSEVFCSSILLLLLAFIPGSVFFSGRWQGCSFLTPPRVKKKNDKPPLPRPAPLYLRWWWMHHSSSRSRSRDETTRIGVMLFRLTH